MALNKLKYILLAVLLSTAGVQAANDRTVPGSEFIFSQIATPANPSVGKNKIYVKSDDLLYILDSSGVETQIGATGANTALSNLTTTAINQDLNLSNNDVNEVLNLSMATSGNPAIVYPDSGGIYIHSVSENVGIYSDESPTPELTTWAGNKGVDNDSNGINIYNNETSTAGRIQIHSEDASGVVSVGRYNGVNSPGSVAIGGASVTVYSDLSLNSNKITNLATPTASTDAATKAYVDSASSPPYTATFTGTSITPSATNPTQMFTYTGGSAQVFDATGMGTIASFTDGVIIRIVGTDDTNTLTINDSDISDGRLMNGNAVLGKGNVISFQYNSTLARMVEISRNF